MTPNQARHLFKGDIVRCDRGEPPFVAVVTDVTDVDGQAVIYCRPMVTFDPAGLGTALTAPQSTLRMAAWMLEWDIEFQKGLTAIRRESLNLTDWSGEAESPSDVRN